jgi:hypothetical protein
MRAKTTRGLGAQPVPGRRQRVRAKRGPMTGSAPIRVRLCPPYALRALWPHLIQIIAPARELVLKHACCRFPAPNGGSHDQPYASKSDRDCIARFWPNRRLRACRHHRDFTARRPADQSSAAAIKGGLRNPPLVPVLGSGAAGRSTGFSGTQCNLLRP